jgi:hypothetical protein
MNNENKPVNLGKYSDFIQVPKPYLRVKKKKSPSINVLTLIAHEGDSPESYDKKMKLYARLNRVQDVLKGRELKFIKQWFAVDVLNKALDGLEKELGIENL